MGRPALGRPVAASPRTLTVSPEKGLRWYVLGNRSEDLLRSFHRDHRLGERVKDRRPARTSRERRGLSRSLLSALVPPLRHGTKQSCVARSVLGSAIFTPALTTSFPRAGSKSSGPCEGSVSRRRDDSDSWPSPRILRRSAHWRASANPFPHPGWVTLATRGHRRCVPCIPQVKVSGSPPCLAPVYRNGIAPKSD